MQENLYRYYKKTTNLSYAMFVNDFQIFLRNNNQQALNMKLKLTFLVLLTGIELASLQQSFFSKKKLLSHLLIIPLLELFSS